MGISSALNVGSVAPGVCTSTTRPANPFEGQMIYETDTDVLSIYNGSAWVTITPQSATVNTSQTVASASYNDLATVGPQVTIQTGTKALVTISGIAESSFNNYMWMSFAVSGATTIAASDDNGSYFREISATGGMGGSISRTLLITSLNVGSNTFTMKYRGTSTNAVSYRNRSITVVGIP